MSDMNRYVEDLEFRNSPDLSRRRQMLFLLALDIFALGFGSALFLIRSILEVIQDGLVSVTAQAELSNIQDKLLPLYFIYFTVFALLILLTAATYVIHQVKKRKSEITRD